MDSVRVAVISSAQDEAGRNIRRHLEEILSSRGPDGGERDGTGPRFELHEIDGRLIHAEGVDREFPSDLIIFISRHSGREEAPVLTVHATGNLAGAGLGGRPRSLPPTCPPWMQAVLKGLRARAPPGYAASYEVVFPTATGMPMLRVNSASSNGS